MTEKLDAEETQKFVDAEIPILVFIEKGKKVYYKLVKVIDDKLLKQGLMYRFVPLTNAEMKAQGVEESTAQEVNDASPIDIEESAAEAVAEEKKSNLTLSGDKDAVRAARKILEEKMASAKPVENEKTLELQDEVEDLKNKLGIIAEKKLDEKRKAVSEKVNALVVDPQKRSEILEQIKEGSPEKVSMLDQTMNMLSDQLNKSNQQRNERYEPAGSAPLNPDYAPNKNQDIYSQKFQTYESMIQALRDESKSEDKQKAQRANTILNTFLNKYATNQKNIHEEQRYSPDDSIPKTDKVPTVDFSQANEPYSELERFGIRKSPLNYSHNSRKIVGQKGNGEGD